MFFHITAVSISLTAVSISLLAIQGVITAVFFHITVVSISLTAVSTSLLAIQGKNSSVYKPGKECESSWSVLKVRETEQRMREFSSVLSTVSYLRAKNARVLVRF